MNRIVKLCLLVVSSMSTTCLLHGCMTKSADPFYLLTGSTKGIWEWERTTTPSRVVTPQSVGYTKQLAVLSDDQGAYIAFYRNDSLQRRANETSRDTSHTIVDDKRKTVLIKYGGAGYIMYRVGQTGKSTVLTVSEFLNPYTPQADTVHSTYRAVTKRLYPY